MLFKISSEPVVSVIMPTYNRADLILYSINAILKQTYKKWELIIVDDGSTDETQKIVASIKDNRVKYFFQKNAGVSAARNLGIKKSRGQWISFCDSDDIYFYTRLAKFLKAVKNKDCLAYSGWLESFRLQDKIIINRFGYGVLPNFDPDVFQCKNLIFASAAMVKKSCLDKVGYFDEQLTYEEDWDLFLRLFDHFPVYQLKFPSFIFLVGQVGDPDKGHQAQENVKKTREYLFEKRIKTLLTLYEKNKDFSVAKKIFLTCQRLPDSPQKYEMLLKLDPIRNWLEIWTARQTSPQASLNSVFDSKKDPFINYLIKSTSPLLHVHLPGDIYCRAEFSRFQKFFEDIFKKNTVEKFYDPLPEQD